MLLRKERRKNAEKYRREKKGSYAAKVMQSVGKGREKRTLLAPSCRSKHHTTTDVLQERERKKTKI
jgi:hypothetical protein